MATPVLAGCFLGFVVALGAQSPLAVAGLPDGAPLAITARAAPDSLIVEVALQPEWHIYARDVGGGQPVAVTLDAGCDFVAAGKLGLPPDAGGKLTGHVRLTLPIAAKSDGAVMRATLDLQVCDPLECLEPMSVLISGEVARAFEVLLVVDDVDERSSRIETFLAGRGFDVDVTTYAKVTAEACGDHAVVLADSKLFGKSKGVRQHVLKFPKSKTPIVAVGFFGTELIEAHGIAMTSGYI